MRPRPVGCVVTMHFTDADTIEALNTRVSELQEDLRVTRRKCDVLVRDLNSFAVGLQCNPSINDLLARTAGLAQLERDVEDMASQVVTGTMSHTDVVNELLSLAASRRGRQE